MEKEIKIFLAVLALLAGTSFAVFYFLNNNEEAFPPISKNQNIVYEPQTNSEEQVIITVTPKNISPDASAWEFEIVLDTHSVELDYDLMKNSALIDSAGNKYSSLEWVGDPPGGHHRKGVLKFRSIADLPESVKLEFYNIGGIIRREFIWSLK